MKKILSLLSLLMLFVMTASADTVVLSAPTSSAKTYSDADGIITITDATDNTGIQVGSGKLAYDGGSATPMKLSGTRQFNLSYSAAVTVTKVWLYATNAKASTDSGYKAGTIGLDSKDRTSLGNLPEKGETPLKVDITGKAGLNANTQFLAVIVVEYSSTAPSLTVSPKELSFSLNPSVPTKTQSFTLTGKNLTNGTYDISVPSVTGLTVTPTQFTVAEGAVSQEVQVTYASTEDVAKATADITATVGEQTAKVTLSYQSRAAAYTQSTVSDAAVWDWTKVTGSVELTAETTPTKEDEFLLADVDDRVEFPAAFGDAKALMMTGFQFPTNSAGYAQGKTIKFKTSVPGVLTVEFSNTGTSDRPDRYLNVNGVNTTFKSKNTDKVTATDINVPAGEVVLMGNMVDTGAESGFTPNMLRWYKITFTPKAFVPYVQPTEVTFDFENNNMNMPYSTGAGTAAAELQNAGNLAGKTIRIDDVTATFVNSPTMATKMAKIGSAKGQLQAIEGAQIRFTAPEGYAITKIVITPLNASVKKWSVDNNVGELSEDFLTWTGNASSVRFTATGSLFLTKIDVTLAEKDANTTEAIYDTYASEVNSIAEFKALDNNTLTKLNLTNAAITVRSINEQAFYVQDATGGAHFYFANLDLKVNDILNGYVFVKKSNQLRGTRIAMTEATNADNLMITHDATVTPADATVEQASAFTEITAEKYYDSELMNKLVKLTGVKVKGIAETEATISDANDANKTIRINNSKTNEFPYVIKDALTDIDYANATVIGIVCHSQTTTNPKTQFNCIMPISIVDNGTVGIRTVGADNENVQIYNLQGVRLNQLQRGLNIVNGKKIVVK